jgi:hypothetical protein
MINGRGDVTARTHMTEKNSTGHPADSSPSYRSGEAAVLGKKVMGNKYCRLHQLPSGPGLGVVFFDCNEYPLFHVE